MCGIHGHTIDIHKSIVLTQNANEKKTPHNHIVLWIKELKENLAACALYSQEQQKPGTKTEPQEWSRWFLKFITHTHSIQEKSKTWVWYIIPFIRIEKSPFSWWRKNSKVNTSSGSSHRKSHTRKDRTNKQNRKHTPLWTKVQVSHLFRDHQQKYVWVT
jgi:hypothetical protein